MRANEFIYENRQPGWTSDEYRRHLAKHGYNHAELSDQELEEGWKQWAAGAALGLGALGAQGAVTQAPAQAQLQPKAAMTQPAAQQAPAAAQAKAPAAAVTATQAKAPAAAVTATQAKVPAAAVTATGDATAAGKLLADPEAQVLIKVAQAAGMKGQELAQFLAQCAHETANFSSLKEFGGSLDFRKYDIKFNPKKAKTLGNTQAGDGSKYKGRGFIQLTGKGNYKRAGDALGLPLVAQPDLLERPDVAAKVAVWYWNDRVVPKVTNFADTASATKPINGGTNGLSDRTNKYADIMALMQQPRRT